MTVFPNSEQAYRASAMSFNATISLYSFFFRAARDSTLMQLLSDRRPFEQKNLDHQCGILKKVLTTALEKSTVRGPGGECDLFVDSQPQVYMFV